MRFGAHPLVHPVVEDPWRLQVEARLASLERQLAQPGAWLLRPAEEPPGRQAAVAQSEAEFSDDSEEGLCSTSCVPPDDEKRSLSRAENGDALAEVTVEQLDQTGQTYALSESVWDVTLLAFLDCVGPGCSLILVLLVCLNVFVQGVFCEIVMENMLNDDAYSDEKLSGLLKFRTSTAHSIRQADFTAKRSLASQICFQDDTLPWAGSQFNLYSQINHYLGEGGYAGAKLCYLSVFLWLVRMQTEMNEVFHCASSVLQLRRRGETLLASSGEDGPPKLLYVARGRQLSMLAVLSLRLGIAFLLTYIGVRYLVTTVSLPDLILNSMALVFVIDIDEMLYECFAPTRVKNLLTSLEPLAFKQPPCLQRLPSATSWGKMLSVSSVLLITGLVVLNPFYERVAMAGEIMCTGNLDFVYTVNPTSGIVEATPTHKHNSRDHGLVERATVVKLAFPDLFPGIRAEKNGDATTENPGRALMHKGKAHNFWTEKMHPEAGVGGPHQLPVLRGWSRISGMAALLNAMVSPRLTAKVVVDTEDLDALAGGPQNFDAEQGKLSVLHSLEVGGAEGGAAEDVTCYDILPAQLPAAFKSAMLSVFPNSTITANYSSMDDLLLDTPQATQDCRKFRSFCHLMNMTKLRALCPITCGCAWGDRPRAGFFGHQRWGCPASCKFLRMATLSWDALHHRSPSCADAKPEDFASNDTRHVPAPKTRLSNFLAAYMDGAFEFLQSRSDFTLNAKLITHKSMFWRPLNLSVPQQEEVAVYMTSWAFLRATQAGRWELMPGIPHPRGKKGCEFWVSWEVVAVLGINLCERSFFRSLRYDCPQACQCTHGMDECPAACTDPAR